MQKRTLTEGSTRSQVKGGVVEKPKSTSSTRPSGPPPAPKKKDR